MSEDLREAVARAICSGCDEDPDNPGDCRGNDHRWQDYLEPADAAIAVMSKLMVSQYPSDAELIQKFLSWRCIDAPYDKPCGDCGGAGSKAYGSTATYHGGVGGQAITADICGKCWGSGVEGKPFRSLKMRK